MSEEAGTSLMSMRPAMERRVRGDHDSETGLGERQLVGVQDEQLVHHHDRSRLLPLTYSTPQSTP